MSAIKKIIKNTLIEHQHSYNMLTANPKPVSYCNCGVQTVIKLPKDMTQWFSSKIEEAEIEAHASHQAEVLLEEISK